MTPEQFTYWLQGFNEITNGLPPTAEGWKVITDHLALVFKKETPKYALPLPMRIDPNLKPGEWRFEQVRENNLPSYCPAIC